MRTVQKLFGVIVLICLVSVFVGDAAANEVELLITFDENGNGTFLGEKLDWAIVTDPGPGGLPNALAYLPPFGPETAGDLLIEEPTGGFSDVVRFNVGATSPYGTIVFYSEVPEDAAEMPDLADIGLPEAFYPNPIVLVEKGSEGNNWVDYTPVRGQPGYLDNYPGATYHIISDIPEPSTLALLSISALGILTYTWRRRK
jgi:hypothetical protein